MSEFIADLKFLQKSKKMVVVFDDEKEIELTYEFLRVYSPSAEVRGHHPSQATVQTGKREVSIDKVEPVGNYAVQLFFDDGHNTGLYSFDYLFEIASERDELWDLYLKSLTDNKVDRDSPMKEQSPKACGS